MRAGRLGFGRVSLVCRSFVDYGSFVEPLMGCGTEELETEVAFREQLPYVSTSSKILKIQNEF